MDEYSDKDDININNKKISIDVENIMDDIRKQIKAEKYALKMPPFSVLNIDKKEVNIMPLKENSGENWEEFIESLHNMNIKYSIPYYWNFQTGKVINFVKRVIRKLIKCVVYPILTRQVEYNAMVVRCMNTVRYFIENQRNTNHTLRKEIEHLKEESNQIRAKLEEQIAYLKNENNRIIANFEDKITHLKGENNQIRTNFENQITSLRDENNQIIIQFEAHSNRINVIEEHIYKVDEQLDKYIAIDYFKFQNNFRGTRSQIIARQEKYIKYFKDKNNPILDIGCGRGEFLQLMKENNINAYGIDLYPEYVTEGKLNGIDIRQGDGINYLVNTSEVFSGIFISHVIEHISFESLQILCKSAFDKLETEGYLILETPNPTSLSIYTSSFYIDPTHIKPVHPLTIEYILKEIGFKDIEILYTEDSKTDPLPLIKSSAIDNIDSINEAIQRVSNMLYGSLDYAVIAKK